MRNIIKDVVNRLRIEFDEYKDIKEYGVEVHYDFDSKSDDVVSTFLNNRFIDSSTFDGYKLRLYSGNLQLELWASRLQFLGSNVRLLKDWSPDHDKDFKDSAYSYGPNGDSGYADCIFKSENISLSYKTLLLLKPNYIKLKCEYEIKSEAEDRYKFNSILNEIAGVNK